MYVYVRMYVCTYIYVASIATLEKLHNFHLKTFITTLGQAEKVKANNK